MELIIGAAIGAGALAVVIAISTARAAKEADEVEAEFRRLKEQNEKLLEIIEKNSEEEYE